MTGMKVCFAALAALAALGTTRAAAADWTDWQDGESRALTSASWSIASNSAYGYNGGSDFAFRVTYTLAEGATLQNGSAWARLLAMDHSETIYEFQSSGVGGASKTWMSHGGYVQGDTFANLLATNDNSLTFSFEYDHSAKTLTYLVNDVALHTVEGVNINAWVTFKAGDACRPLDRLFPTDGTVTYETAFSTTRAPIPEPTALALLALGVAGVALRRRAM